ncbi:hypothetical protein LCGC14_1709510 [marine sediment metagenome]|uniref:Uncharacterized protein n=1 Tax=marine sediment metagenome TaxID=412755 RepID=A0A0F9HG74_9ZZZZ
MDALSTLAVLTQPRMLYKRRSDKPEGNHLMDFRVFQRAPRSCARAVVRNTSYNWNLSSSNFFVFQNSKPIAFILGVS